jgi:hypothetical protein
MEPLFFLGFGATIVPLALLVLAIVVVIGGRKEPDPDHQRPPATYYALVQFLTIFVVLFATLAVASSLLNLTTDDDGGSGVLRRSVTRSYVELDQGDGGGYARMRAYDGSEDDADWSNAVRGLIVVVVAGGIYLMHERRRPRFPRSSPGRRIWTTYLYAACFVAIVTAAAAFVAALFNGWEAVAPGVTGGGPRSEGLRDFGATAILAVGAALIFWRHLRWAEPRPATAPPPGFAPPQPPAPQPPAGPPRQRPPEARPPRPAEAGERPSRPRPPGTKRAAPPRKRSSS